MGKASSDMIMQMSSDVARIFAHGPRSDCRRLAHGGIALSGEPGADINLLLLTGGASKEELGEALEAVKAKGVDALLIVEEGADAVRGWAVEAGLTEVSQIPLMERRADETAPASDFSVRIAGPDETPVGNHLAAAAFSLDEASLLVAVPESLMEVEGNDLWLAEENGEPLGSGMFIRTGDRVGIYTMATPPKHQRRGVGRAILNTAMAHYQGEGVTRFTLGATEVGYPLYERIGFKIVTSPHVYVIGTSTQFPGS